ncbi:MAG: PilN domain-containing protein [Chitinivibrionales bacterium]|nr:PilN domain-containing protein [Chitinivibrionales bacterium]
MMDRIEINLLPAEYRIHRRVLKLQREIVYPVLGVLLMLFGLWSYGISMDASIHHLRVEIAGIDNAIISNRHVLNEINALKKAKTVIQEKIRALQRINVNREKWVRLLEIFCERLPNFTWISSIQEASGLQETLKVEGMTYSFQEVANFMSKLSESGYITSVDLIDIMQTEETDKPYHFTISCTLNPDYHLSVAAQP